MDPARFWEITPRLYHTEMNGAARRIERERSHVWWSAMMPHLKKPPSHDEFCGVRRKVEKQSPEMLLAMMTALAAAWGAEKVEADGN